MQFAEILNYTTFIFILKYRDFIKNYMYQKINVLKFLKIYFLHFYGKITAKAKKCYIIITKLLIFYKIF